MKVFARVLATFGILLVSFRIDAHDASMPHHEWFNAQEMNRPRGSGSASPGSHVATTATYSKPVSGWLKIARTSGNT
jgi:hypothetical protein